MTNLDNQTGVFFKFADQDVWSIRPNFNSWDFVELFYPNYDGSSLIALSNDMAALISEDMDRETFNKNNKEYADWFLSAIKQESDRILSGIFNQAHEHYDVLKAAGTIQTKMGWKRKLDLEGVQKIYISLANIRKQLDFIKLDVSDEFISNCMRVEYLGRPLVDGIEYEIADNRIRIDSPHTNYINITRHEKISLENILSMINEMDAIRKADRRIKVKGISTIRKRVKDAYKLYLIDWEVYNEAFNKCIVLAKQVEREGVHYGTSDDAVLEEIIKSRFIIDRLGYGGTNYSTMLELNNSVKSALNACRTIDIDCLKIKINI